MNLLYGVIKKLLKKILLTFESQTAICLSTSRLQQKLLNLIFEHMEALAPAKHPANIKTIAALAEIIFTISSDEYSIY